MAAKPAKKKSAKRRAPAQGPAASSRIRLGLIQLGCRAGPEGNLEKTLAQARKAARQGAQIICLEELFRSEYFCQKEDLKRFDLAEPVPGPTSEAFRDLAAEEDVAVVASIFEKRAQGVYHNTALVIDAGGKLLGKYRKMHIPDDPQFMEKYYFTPGDLGFQVFQTKFARVAPLVCWDQWFPEGARLAALAGAQILVYPTAIGWLDSEPPVGRRGMKDAWTTIQRSHAIANGLFVASVNRVGHEGPAGKGITFWGGSFVCDPFGRMIEAAGQGEEALVASCDLSAIEKQRRNWPFLRDRRIDAYAGLTRRLLDE